MVETHGLSHISLAVVDPQRDHHGFRLKKPEDITLAVAEVQRAGGTLLRQREFGLGRPFAYVADPDSYEIEIWFE